MKKFNKILNIFIIALISVYAVRVIYSLCMLIFKPEHYMLTSAPWYTGILVDGILVAILLMVCAICKLIIFVKSKKTEKR